MALLSPGIQLFESSSTPAAIVAAAENGVATLGFSTRGPVNKLTKVSSVAEFNEIFGDPIKDNYYAHILMQSVLANNTDAYFMRVVDEHTAATAQCPVVDFDIKGAKVAIKDNISKLYSGYFMTHWKAAENSGVTEPTHTPIFRVSLNYADEEQTYVDTAMTAVKSFGPAGKIEPPYSYVLWVPISEVINNLTNSVLGDYFKFTEVDDVDDENPQVGMIITAKNDKMFDANHKVNLSITIGAVDGDAITDWTHDDENVIADFPTPLSEGEFDGEVLRDTTTLVEFEDLTDYNRFNLVAKYPGSSMDDFKIVKTTNTSALGEETWVVSVYDGEKAIESRTFKSKDFDKEMSNFAYIDVKDKAFGKDENDEPLDKWTWKDGTWVLGYGEKLTNGEYWQPNDSLSEEQEKYVVVKGNDGYPLVDLGDGPQYSEQEARVIYLNALGSDDFINVDEYSFSILAIPSCQNIMVQNAAIDVCAARGDAIFLADIPREKCKSKTMIDDVVAWANGNSRFQSSYCAIYYGWFAQTNPYVSDNSIFCPASCFIAPKMVALDQSMGEFYAPAGLTRGNLICSDWLYSPDQKDRDKLVGNDNVVNPISYSNTRGVTIMAQKTTDRTTSPLNRVGVRRMTNMIKRNLRSRLYGLLFEPNNEVARAKARNIVDDILSGLRTSNCIQTYDVNVVSGTGANRNDLNVYVNFAPYGLVEKIYVYLNITDAGVEVTEEVA